MRILVLSILSVSAVVGAQSDAGKLWTDLAAKREALKTFHQEFDVSVVFKLSADKTQASKHSLIVDWSQGQWREKSLAGWGSDITIFDGSEILRTEDGADEYTRSKPKGKKGEAPLPSPYQVNSANWAKAVEAQRLPCGIPGTNDECVIIQVPLEPGIRGASGQGPRIAQGNVRLMIDTVSGLLLATNTGELMENGRTSYTSETVYRLKRLSYGAPADAALFKIPDDLRQVKELSAWNAAKIKKRLAGSPAPALTAKDIHGNPVSLEALKGKIVLLDFFTSWCAPCRPTRLASINFTRSMAAPTWPSLAFPSPKTGQSWKNSWPNIRTIIPSYSPVKPICHALIKSASILLTS